MLPSCLKGEEKYSEVSVNCCKVFSRRGLGS